MDPTLKDDLIKQHGSLASFAEKTSDEDFIWGISDLFGYQTPADFPRLDTRAQQLVALSFFCKEYLQGGFAAVVENLPEHLLEISSGLSQHAPGQLAEEFQQILTRANDQGILLDDDDARWEFIESSQDFREASANCQDAFIGLLTNLRATVKSL